MSDPPALRRILARAGNWLHDDDMLSVTPREAKRWIRAAYRAGCNSKERV